MVDIFLSRYAFEKFRTIIYLSIKYIIGKDPLFALVRKMIFDRTINQPFSASSKSFIKNKIKN